jgi:hypothetical protein
MQLTLYPPPAAPTSAAFFVCLVIVTRAADSVEMTLWHHPPRPAIIAPALFAFATAVKCDTFRAAAWAYLATLPGIHPALTRFA